MNSSLKQNLIHMSSAVGLERMIVLSVLFHVIVIVLIIVSPLLPLKGRSFPSFYMVNLVSPPQRESLEIKKNWVTKEVRKTGSVRKSKSRPLKKAARDAPVTRLSKKIAKAEVLSNKVSKKKRVKKSTKGADQEAGSSKIQEAISKIKGEVSKRKSVRAPVSGAKSGVIASETTDLRFKIYYTIIWGKIREGWILPEGLMDDRNDLEAIMTFRITKDGKIKDIQFEKTSGNLYFDRSVRRAVEKADPLPPVPEDYKQDYLDVGVRFRPFGA